MRLICPNCGAQYEVSDDVIPEGGRDVQCSNCGHTWFEQPGASAAAEEVTEPEAPTEDAVEETRWDEEEAAPEPEPEPVPEPAPEPEPEPEQVPDVEADPEVAPQDDAARVEEGFEEEQEAQEQETAPVARRPIDAGVADILREESAREETLRQREAESLESQPDLGLSEAETPPEDRRTREANVRMARLRGEAPEADGTDARAAAGPAAAAAAAAATVASGTRKYLLPDIEESTSTLRPDPEARAVAEEVTEAETRSGFRRGFLWVVILALLAVALYVLAPRIVGMVPALEGALTAYVDWVDGLRLSLDRVVQGWIGTETLPPEPPEAPPAEAPAPDVGTEAPALPEAPEAESTGN